MKKATLALGALLCTLLCAAALGQIPAALAEDGGQICRIKDFSKHGMPGAQMTFSKEEFAANIVSGKEPESLMLVALPEPGAGKLLFDGGETAAGAVIPFKSAGLLVFVPASEKEFTAKIALLPLHSGAEADAAGEQTIITLDYAKERNLAPVAGALKVETRKDIEIEISLSGWDPEGDALTYAFGEQKGAGELSVRDGKVYFAPAPGKSGKTSFSYYVKDARGSSSEPAWVTVNVGKKDYELSYTDLEGRPEHFPALMLAKEKVFVGEQIGKTLLFRPDEKITRGEFLSMAMTAMGVPASADVALETPLIASWQSGYMAAALELGITANMDASGPVTGKEAAVTVTRLLGIRGGDSVFEAEALGILKSGTEPGEELTRARAAEIIYRMGQVSQGVPLGWRVYSPAK